MSIYNIVENGVKLLDRKFTVVFAAQISMIPNQVGRNSNVVALEPTSLYSAYRHRQGELQGLKRLQFANTGRPASYACEIGYEASSWSGHPLNTTHQDTSTVAGDPQSVKARC